MLENCVASAEGQEHTQRERKMRRKERKKDRKAKYGGARYIGARVCIDDDLFE